MDAHEAGSANTPSFLAISGMLLKFLHLLLHQFYHLILLLLQQHNFQLAGFPIRIAVAIVSGFSIHLITNNRSCTFCFKPLHFRKTCLLCSLYSLKPFQYAVIFPAFPTGIAKISGAVPKLYHKFQMQLFFGLQYDMGLQSLQEQLVISH